jgi:methyl-CpG-binding domain protein 4
VGNSSNHTTPSDIQPTTRKAQPQALKKRNTTLSNYAQTLAASRTPSISANSFGLIQETVAHDLFQLVVAAMLWNRTRGSQARPIFLEMLRRYPSVEALASAEESDIANLLQPLGLHNSRAKRFLALAKTWVDRPPSAERRYRRLHYPSAGCGKEIGAGEVLGPDDPREGWEIAHLPGVGPYALDSFRIFHRDELRGLATDWNGAGASPGFEPEWKRVVPLDKELKAYLQWMWLREGWIWDPSSGRRRKMTMNRLQMEKTRIESLSPEML